MHKPIKYAEKALTYAAGAAWIVFDKLNRIGRNPGLHAQMVRQAPAEVLGEDQAAAGLAAPDRFAVPALRPGDPQADSGRQDAARRAIQRASPAKSKRRSSSATARS